MGTICARVFATDSGGSMNAVIQHPRRALALGVAIALALLALLPGSWGDALAQTAGQPTPSPTTVTVPVTPGATTTAPLGGSSAGTKTVTVPAGAFTQAVEVRTEVRTFQRTVIQGFTLAGVTYPPIVSTGAEVVDVSTVVLEVFDLAALTAGNEEVQPGEPVTLSFELSAETLAAANGDPNNVRLAFYDEDAERWEDVTCAVVGTALECTLPHFSLWALYAVQEQAPSQEGTPATTPSPANTGMGDSSESAATNTVGIALGAIALAGILGAGGRYAMGRRSA